MKTADRQTALDKFSDNTFSYLVAVDALNAGLNVKDANSAICVSGVSTELVAYQQIGRIIRLKDETAMFINLYSDNSIEENWVKKKTTNIPNIHWIQFNQLKDYF